MTGNSGTRHGLLSAVYTGKMLRSVESVRFSKSKLEF